MPRYCGLLEFGRSFPTTDAAWDTKIYYLLVFPDALSISTWSNQLNNTNQTKYNSKDKWIQLVSYHRCVGQTLIRHTFFQSINANCIVSVWLLWANSHHLTGWRCKFRQNMVQKCNIEKFLHSSNFDRVTFALHCCRGNQRYIDVLILNAVPLTSSIFCSSLSLSWFRTICIEGNSLAG